MGRLQAEEMASRLPQEQALQWHLQCNHYPPIHQSFVKVAEEAIQMANDGDWEHTIVMPNGKTLSVAEIIEGMHLDSFLDGVD